jgi:hypothetical protein
MKKNSGNVVASVELFTTDAGGRAGPTEPTKLGCLMSVDGHNFDVRLHLEDTGPIFSWRESPGPHWFSRLGQRGKFHLRRKPFILRELRAIGRGVIEEVMQK